MARFGTVINCIDGRVQEPVARWLKETYQLDFVDVITEPGPDRALAEGRGEIMDAIKAKAGVSIHAHRSNVLALAGHHDCAGNPATPDEHRRQIESAIGALRLWNFAVTLVGLWINDEWQVEVVAG